MIWCSGRDSNPHGFLHTPLKRARLPITPPELIYQKNYLFAGASAFAAGAFAAGAAVFAAGAALVLASPAGAVFEFASAAGAVFALLSDVTVGSPGFAESTETLPVSAGIESNNADSIKTHAALIVTLESTVAVPRGANAELDTLLVNKAPASVFPGCSNTAATRIRHERKNKPYKK